MTNRKLDLIAAELSAAQHGAFALRQLDDERDRRAAMRRAAAGKFDRRASGLYTPKSAVKTWEHELSVALLAHPGSVIGVRAAAGMHRWPSYPEGVVELLGSYSANCRSVGPIHRTKDLRDEDITEVRGLPVTTQLRTAIDIAAVVGKRRLQWLLDDLLAADAFTLDELTNRFHGITRRGKPGMANLRWFVESRGPGYVPPASRLERLLSDVLRPLGEPYPVRQYPLPSRGGPGRVDVAYPIPKVIIEGDSRRWHQRLADMENDRLRDAEAAMEGWITLRFTWQQLVENPDWVRSVVLAVLRDRGDLRSLAISLQ